MVASMNPGSNTSQGIRFKQAHPHHKRNSSSTSSHAVSHEATSPSGKS